LQEKGFELELRDLAKDRLTVEELEGLIGDRDYRAFLNSRNELYRERGMKENPPPRREAIRMMAEEPNFIRRPLILCSGRIVVGFDEEAIKGL
jgi:arsenate reductase-like glutaredoxin family protein